MTETQITETTVATEIKRVKRHLVSVDYRLGNIEADVSNLKSGQVRVERRLDGLESRLDTIETNQEGMKDDIASMKGDIALLKDNVADLKGDNYEQKIRDNATGIFFQLRRGKNAEHIVSDALDAMGVSEAEREQVFYSDLLWYGKNREGKEFYLVCEVSWAVSQNDIDRAVQRAEICRRAGLNAIPVVAGKRWRENDKETAQRQGVVIVEGTRLHKESWRGK